MEILCTKQTQKLNSLTMPSQLLLQLSTLLVCTAVAAAALQAPVHDPARPRNSRRGHDSSSSSFQPNLDGARRSGSELRVLAMVCARAGSMRLPLKNLRLLDGKPVIQYTVETAQVKTDFPRCAGLGFAGCLLVHHCTLQQLAAYHSTSQLRASTLTHTGSWRV